MLQDCASFHLAILYSWQRIGAVRIQRFPLLMLEAHTSNSSLDIESFSILLMLLPKVLHPVCSANTKPSLKKSIIVQISSSTTSVLNKFTPPRCSSLQPPKITASTTSTSSIVTLQELDPPPAEEKEDYIIIDAENVQIAPFACFESQRYSGPWERIGNKTSDHDCRICYSTL